MTRVAVTPRSLRSASGSHVERLRRHGAHPVFPDHDRLLTEAEMVELVEGCDALIVGLDPVTDEVLGAGPLRVVVKYGSGLDNIDVAAARDRGIPIGATPGTNARSVAELTIGLLIALARHIPYHDRRLRAGSRTRRTGRELRGRVLGLVGCGAVGREVGRLGVALGLRVIAHDPAVDEAPSGIELVPLDEVLTGSDVVSLHLPLTEQTHHLIDARAIDRMRPDAMLINTARGGLVDETALADALRAGRLAGAACDVFSQEPPSRSPLLSLDTFVASPHAGAATVEATEATGRRAVDEVLRLLDQVRAAP
jgi:phosphoglycerate dehydrogenase-like enzyme